MNKKINTNINNKNINKNKILLEMCSKQNKAIEKKYLLEYNDMIRILKNIDGNLFSNTQCIIWKGYLTKCNNNKSCYVNFYLKKRKIALHRILYLNFIGFIDDKQYLKFKCNNPGKCCNINHILKVCNNEDNIIIPNTDNDSNNNIINQNQNKDKIKYLQNNIKITKIEKNNDNQNDQGGKIVIIFDD